MNRGTKIDFETDVGLLDPAAQEKEDFQTRRRLRKALALAERFKQKYHLEQQVSSELARRCDDLKTQAKADKVLIDEMRIEIRKLQDHILKSKDDHLLFPSTLIVESNRSHSLSESQKNCERSTSCSEALIEHTAGLNVMELDDKNFEQLPASSGKFHREKIPNDAATINTPAENGSLSRECRFPALRLFEQFLVVGASLEVTYLDYEDCRALRSCDNRICQLIFYLL